MVYLHYTIRSHNNIGTTLSAESLFTMRKPLLRDSFKFRLSLDRTPDAILIFILKPRFDLRLIKNMMHAMNKPV